MKPLHRIALNNAQLTLCYLELLQIVSFIVKTRPMSIKTVWYLTISWRWTGYMLNFQSVKFKINFLLLSRISILKSSLLSVFVLFSFPRFFQEKLIVITGFSSSRTNDAPTGFGD